MVCSRKALTVAGYVAGTASKVRVLHVSEAHTMRADAAIAFLRMEAAAAAAGITLKVNSGFRSHEEQEVLYRKYLGGTGALAAKPGYSNHQGGIAVDIQTGGESTPTYAWLAREAWRYGFKRTVPSEPWHWEFRPEEVGGQP
ncbi:M15 family metallopeptidase [Hyalangium gracile]|uniref:M15 family metallopeptidase n=1 Tax=Hyalangium gracile TaxID=394092 RepID=UPI001CCCA66E|nr:D-alanyl-D-alanine carboxypeptidase family protein [Hyalangium gracile]